MRIETASLSNQMLFPEKSNCQTRDDFAVTVYNTLNNHCQTIPTRYKVTTEKAPSGLLGPMALVVEKRAEQRKITKPLFML